MMHQNQMDFNLNPFSGTTVLCSCSKRELLQQKQPCTNFGVRNGLASLSRNFCAFERGQR
jgi:hypothetical protein